MSELFLILHKVRGEPAFDIAVQMITHENNTWWIIPTSGHRAYPCWNIPLSEVLTCDGECVNEFLGNVPADLPDHYDVKRDDGSHLVNAAREILMRKGLISAAKPSQPAYRRV